MTISDISNATVLVRIDANLPSLVDTFRLEAVCPTIDTLLKNGNTVLMLTHWGRPGGTIADQLSTRHLVPVMEKVFQHTVCAINQFAEGGFDLAAEEITKNVECGQRLFVLENTRFHPSEKSKDEIKRAELSKKYATLGQFFVDEAFAVSHRKEATNYDLKHLLPWVLGTRHTLEIETLTAFKTKPKQPTTVILGGAKPETKLTLIESLLPRTHHFLLGGLLAFTFLQAKWELEGNTGVSPLVEDTSISVDFVPTAKRLLSKNGDTFILPTDIVWHTENNVVSGRDIGPKTLQRFSRVIDTSATIFWNGPVGVSTPPFDAGTKSLIERMQTATATTIIGGGDTAAAIPPDAIANFDFISTGGGATLDFLAR